MVQTEVLYKQMTVYAVLFTFDELHSMALLNARFWQSSGFADEHWVAYVPPGFKSLAFMADEIVEYPENLCLYRSYSEVSETIRGGLYNLWRSRFWISVFYRLRLRNDWLRRALRLSATPRARHFFYGSGISSWAVRDAREKYRDERLRILLAQDFTVLVDGEVVLQSPDLTASYHQRFSRLAAAISEGMRLVVLSGGGGADAILRTRNFAKKAVVHNSDAGTMRALARTVLSEGKVLWNIGSPCTELGIVLESYCEWSNKFSLDEEVALCNAPTLTPGDAALFTLFACIDAPLCITSPEWSVTVFPHDPVSLMAARRDRDGSRNRDLDWPGGIDQSLVARWLR